MYDVGSIQVHMLSRRSYSSAPSAVKLGYSLGRPLRKAYDLDLTPVLVRMLILRHEYDLNFSDQSVKHKLHNARAASAGDRQVPAREQR